MNCQGLEDREALPIGVHALHVELLNSIHGLWERHFESIVTAELRNFHLQLLHQAADHVINLGVDHQLRVLIDRGPLQVDHDKFAAQLVTESRDLIGWCDTNARAHAEHQVTERCRCEGDGEDVHVHTLAKRNDCVLQFAIALGAVAEATCGVDGRVFRDADLEVAHVLAIALVAQFEVHVAVELGDLLRIDSTLVMKAIDVHTDAVLELATIHQLHQRHVSQRWLRLLDCHIERHAVGPW